MAPTTQLSPRCPVVDVIHIGSRECGGLLDIKGGEVAQSFPFFDLLSASSWPQQTMSGNEGGQHLINANGGKLRDVC